MKIADFFVDVGLMGADKLFKGLDTANKSLTQIKESGLEAAEKLRSGFGKFEGAAQNFSQFGTNLKIFASATGLSALELQKFQQAFLGVNVSAEETQGTIMNLQNIMSDIQRGRPVSQAVALALSKAHIDPANIKNIYEFVDKLRGVAKNMNVDIGRSIFQDLGVGTGFYQGLRRLKGDIHSVVPLMGQSAIDASAAMSAKIETMQLRIHAKIANLMVRPEVQKGLDAMYRVAIAMIDMLGAIVKFADSIGLIKTVGDFLTSLSEQITGSLGTVGKFFKTLKPGQMGELWDFIKKETAEGRLGSLVMGGAGVGESVKGAMAGRFAAPTNITTNVTVQGHATPQTAKEIGNRVRDQNVKNFRKATSSQNR